MAQEHIGALGAWLERNRRPGQVAKWRKAMFAVLAALAVLSFVVPNHHPHFGVDRAPLFWPCFAFLAGVAMVFFVKKLVQPLIKRPEGYYGDL